MIKIKKFENIKIGYLYNSPLIVYFTKRFMKDGKYTYIEQALVKTIKKIRQAGIMLELPTLIAFLINSLYLNIEHRPRRVGKEIKQIPSPVRRNRLLKKNLSFFANIIKSNTNNNIVDALFEEIIDSFINPRAKLWLEYTAQTNLIYANRLNAHWRW